jgi:pimeloyl-ACP methyl ester carboxylesterase
MRERRPLPKKRLLRRALRADPSQEYLAYVPSDGGPEPPLFVSVHGLSRNAEEQAGLFSPWCEAVGAVLVAPRFAAEQHGDYQRLGRNRADLVLDSILEEVAASTGALAPRIHLFGYSGGAQFAHRYAMAHPQRVARAVVASAGWYTFPDARLRFPYGIRPSPKLPDLCFDPEQFLRVPMLVLVGGKDLTEGGLRRGERIDRQQGVTRVERARSWVAAMRAAADAFHLPPLVSLQEVEGSTHAFSHFAEHGSLAERVFDALFGLSTHEGHETSG